MDLLPTALGAGRPALAGTSVTNMKNLTGTLEFTDPDAANDWRRFYRTVLR